MCFVYIYYVHGIYLVSTSFVGHIQFFSLLFFLLLLSPPPPPPSLIFQFVYFWLKKTPMVTVYTNVSNIMHTNISINIQKQFKNGISCLCSCLTDDLLILRDFKRKMQIIKLTKCIFTFFIIQWHLNDSTSILFFRCFFRSIRKRYSKWWFESDKNWQFLRTQSLS